MEQVDMNILTINMIFALFVIYGRGYTTEAIACGIKMHSFYIYDESVCKTEDPCEEFKEQTNELQKFCSGSGFNSFSNLGSILSSGKYARYVVRKYQRTFVTEILRDAVKDYSLYPSNLAAALALVLAQIYKRGIYYKGHNYKNVIIIFTGTEFPNMDIVQELLNEAFMNNVPVYTFGAGNSVQEDVLKKMSSPPHEKNNNYFLQVHNETLMQVFHKESKTLCDSSDSNDETSTKKDKENTDSEGNDYSESGDIDPNDDTYNDASTVTDTDEEATDESTDDEVQNPNVPDQNEEMDTINNSEADVTESPQKVEERDLEGFGILGLSYIFWILLLLILILLLLFTGVYFLFLNKKAISKSADADAPDEEDNENPSDKNTDSAPLDVSPSRKSNQI